MITPEDELSALKSNQLLRSLRPLDSGSGPQVYRDSNLLWNFASNDYLGLSQHPQIRAAFHEGLEQYGSGSSASRLVCGTLPPHTQLENALAEAKQAEAALTFSSGFAIPIGLIPAILSKKDFIILDKLSHACLVDGARLSGATLRVFPHNDMVKLERLLKSIRNSSPTARILIATESVFSMDGDGCPLPAIVNLAETYQALTLLDEAHGFGLLGATGMGLAEFHGLQHRITFQMGTLSKAAGLSGGYVAGSRAWMDLLVNRARSFIYTTAPPPALAHAALSALHLIRSEEGTLLREQLQHRISLFCDCPQNESSHHSPIQPIILGSNDTALLASQHLETKGYLVPAIRYPTVPKGRARLRVSLSATHPEHAIRSLKQHLSEFLSGLAT